MSSTLVGASLATQKGAAPQLPENDKVIAWKLSTASNDPAAGELCGLRTALAATVCIHLSIDVLTLFNPQASDINYYESPLAGRTAQLRLTPTVNLTASVCCIQARGYCV